MALIARKPEQSVTVVAPAPQTYTAAEIQLAEIYAANAALSSTEGHGYLPGVPEDIHQFRPHKWVVEAICAAMRDVRDGVKPVLGRPFTRVIPTEAVPEHIALVAEGRDLGMITESRMTGDAAGTVYARAAIKVLDEAVTAAYHVSHFNKAPAAQPQAGDPTNEEQRHD